MVSCKKESRTGICGFNLRAPMNLPQTVHLSFLLVVTCLTSAGGCLRRQSHSEELYASAASPSTSTTVVPSHRLSCLPEEDAYAGCLNGGTCFVVLLHENSRLVECSCTSDWTGDRCEARYIDPDHWAVEEAREEARRLAIVLGFGLTAAVLLAVVIVILVIHMRRRKRRVEESKRKKEEEERARQEDPNSISVPLTSNCTERVLVMPVSSV